MGSGGLARKASDRYPVNKRPVRPKGVSVRVFTLLSRLTVYERGRGVSPLCASVVSISPVLRIFAEVSMCRSGEEWCS